MFRLLFVFFLASATFALTPVEEAQYYKVYHLSDIDFEELKAARSHGKNDGLRSTIENPFNGTVPADDGGNFGDLLFSSTLRNGTLVGRDTIINEDTSQNLLVTYERTYSEEYIENFKLLNFGRQRGWVWSASIHHNTGLVTADILIAAGNKIRLLAEAYARP